MIGENATSRGVGFGQHKTGLTAPRARLYAQGAAPFLERIEGALEDVAECARLGLVRSEEAKRLRDVQESMAPLVDECERATNSWGG